MANMPYCMCNNTKMDFIQLTDAVYKYDSVKEFIESRSKDEQYDFARIIQLARELVEAYDSEQKE